MKISKSYIALFLLFLLGLLPFVWLAYGEYVLRASGLTGAALAELWVSGGGALDNPASPLWTAFVSVVGLALCLRVISTTFFLRKSTVSIVLSFSLFLFIMLTKFPWAETNAQRILGAALRYVDYFFIAPVLAIFAFRNVWRLVIPMYVLQLAIVLYLVVPIWQDINWSAISYARDTIGDGGRQTAVSTGYLGLIYAIFLFYRLDRSRPSSLWRITRRALEASLILSMMIVILTTFSRGVFVALFATLSLYLILVSSRSKSRTTLLWLLGGILLVTALQSIDMLEEIFARQGQLSDTTAGRAEIWKETVERITASPENFLFGAGLPQWRSPAHNFVLGILQDYGLFGLLPYLLFHLLALLMLYQISRTAPDLCLRDFAKRGLSICVGTLVVASVDNGFFLNTGSTAFLYYFLIGITIMLSTMRLTLVCDQTLMPNTHDRMPSVKNKPKSNV